MSPTGTVSISSYQTGAYDGAWKRPAASAVPPESLRAPDIMGIYCDLYLIGPWFVVGSMACGSIDRPPPVATEEFVRSVLAVSSVRSSPEQI